MQSVRPDFTAQEVVAAILDSADPVASLAGITVSGGRLNAAGAVQRAASEGPEIYVSLKGKNILDGTGSVDFGGTIESLPVCETFTVTNIGVDTAAPPLSLETIILPSGFRPISNFGSTSLASGESTTFTIQLDAATAGTFNGQISFITNDVDESLFNFTISGVVAPNNPVQIVDNGDSAFEVVGSWIYANSSDFYEGDYHRAGPSTGTKVARWNFAVTPGQYEVAATWYPGLSWASNAVFTVRDGESAWSVQLNQRTAPDDLNADGAAWERLGFFEITGSSLIVQLPNIGNGYLIADAIRINRVGDLPSGGAPTAFDDNLHLDEGSTTTVLVGGATSLLANDTDPDLPGDTLTVTTTPVTNVSHGTLTLNANGTFSYTHDGSEFLTDSFVYQVKDAAGHSDTGYRDHHGQCRERCAGPDGSRGAVGQ